VIASILLAFRMGKAALIGAVGIYIILANIFVVKQIELFGFAATGGNALYGALFLATDLINEHWGKKEAQKAVWFGWGAAIVFLISSQIFLAFAPSGEDFADPAMRDLFGLVPRIVLGSLVAYLISQSHDIIAYNAWKKRTKGRHLWLRNCASTAVSQLIDSLLFAVIAFWGVFPTAVVIEIIVTTYILKLIVAAIDTPFLYLSMKFKPSELKS
jgi:queuosine precursor transporter